MRKAALFLSFVVGVASQSCLLDDSDKVDCGFAGIDASGCQAKGCCWSPAGENSATPWCFFASAETSNYAISSISETAYGFSGQLTKSSSNKKAASFKKHGSSVNEDITNLQLDVFFESESTIRVRIDNGDSSAKPRWQVPTSLIPRIDATVASTTRDYSFSYTNSPFSFEIKRTSDGVSIFKSSESLVFKDQYIELTTAIDPSAKTFGIGESARTTQALQPGRTFTLWAADVASYGKDINLYSSHPFYLQMVNNAAHGVLLLNSNGMDVTLGTDSLTYKVVGGIIDLYVFVGPTPKAVVSQYTALIGRPTMQPYWALGYHNCKYGYTSLAQVQEVVANYSAANIPLDTQWMDIDYMAAYKDFTTDAKNFPSDQVKSFIDGLHANGQHFVPIVDPGIMVQAGYDAYEEGLKQDVFVKDITGQPYLGQVWPGPTYFPDYLNPKTQTYWTDQLKSFHELIGNDGLWIDMNEVSNFCNDDGAGQVCANTAPQGCPAPGASQTDCCLVCQTVDPDNKYDFPPYSINNVKGKLSTKTMPVSGQHYNNITVYDAHNLYGLSEQIMTYSALAEIRGKRPFILSRSSFPSTGVHSAKWTGDNGASWDDLKASIVGILDFNIFGVPMIGADICGFLLDTNEELCARWIEVGAFYPFTRNHNALNQIPQELYLWDSVAEAGRNALNLRYQLLPYLYTQFAKAHFQGLMVAQPLWAEFSSDATALSIDSQWLLGSDLLISPVITQGATSVNAYFPQGLWYALTASEVSTVPVDATAGGKFVTLSTSLTEVNVHVRGGSVVAMQQSAMTTTLARKTPFTLLVALNEGAEADGSLFWDDGEQIELTSFLQVGYHATVSSGLGSVKATIVRNTYPDASALTVNTIVVLGNNLACPAADAVYVNGEEASTVSVACVTSGTSSKITFSNVAVKLSDNFLLTW